MRLSSKVFNLSRRWDWLGLLMGLFVLAGCAGATLARPKSPIIPTPIPALAPSSIIQSVKADSSAHTLAVIFQPDQVKLQLKPVVDGLDRPLFAGNAHDDSGRLFIIEKPGLIRILQAGQLLPTPFLDIQERIKSSGSEQGLLGLAFAPDYAKSGYFFVDYTDLKGDTVIARFQVSTNDPNVAAANSEFIVLQVDQPAANHNGGMLAFGPDGMLFIGLGDGGGSGDTYGNGQNPKTLLGKLLRLDVTSHPDRPYTIPADNPWVKTDWNGVDVRDEVWALGLRNPWRFSFDRQTHDLWIGDVGQNQYEEIDFIPAASQGGLNLGWPLMEGAHCYRDEVNCDTEDLTLPVAEYTHANGCSVTGGYVYRGVRFPVLNGVYFYGDYCNGNIWATWPAPDGAWHTTQVIDTDLSLSSFGEDEAGELYVTDLSGGTLSQLVVEKK